MQRLPAMVCCLSLQPPEREANCVHSARMAGCALVNSEEEERCRHLTNVTKQDQENEVLATDDEGCHEGWAGVCIWKNIA